MKLAFYDKLLISGILFDQYLIYFLLSYVLAYLKTIFIQKPGYEIVMIKV